MARDIDIPYDERAFGAALHQGADGWLMELLEGASVQSVALEVGCARSEVADAIPGGAKTLDDPEKVILYFQFRLNAAGYIAERVRTDRECLAAWALSTPLS